jgi:hypothetical protein
MTLRVLHGRGKWGSPEGGFTAQPPVHTLPDMRHVISLSTIPPRFAAIGPTLQSLVRQRSRPEAVELYIPQSYRRFPDWGGGLPDVPEGVTIRRVDHDFGPATKVLPAARAYRGQDIELLYVDDDQHYAPDWAARFLELRKLHPEAAVCAAPSSLQRMGSRPNPDALQPRVVLAPVFLDQPVYQLRRLGRAAVNAVLRRRSQPALRPPYRMLEQSGYADIAEGYAGVALRPDFLDDLAFDIPPVIWAVDDVWLSGHLARRGVPIWADRRLNLSQTFLAASSTLSLFRAEIEGAGRTAANLACIDHMRATYGIWGGAQDQST